MSVPWLSVVMPTHNGAHFVSAALQSIVEENDANLEVIAIDDGSTDDTVDVLRRFSQRIPMPVIERRVGNWVANTNLGIEQAQGEWLTFLHQDDLWLPGRLAAIRRAVQNVRTPSLVLHSAEFIDSLGRGVGHWTCPLSKESNPSQTVARLLVQNFVPLPSAVFRRRDALSVGGLDPTLWFTADWDFWLKLAALGPTVYLSRSLAAFRVHGSSQTMTKSNRSSDMNRQYQSVFDRHWAIWADRLLDANRVRSAARLSREINVALAARYHREPVAWRALLSAMTTSISDWSYCLRNSRLVERVASRLRARY